MEDVWRGDWVLFSFDAATGVQKWYNPKDDLFKTISEVDEILKMNKFDRAEQAGRAWGSGKRVASIPLDTFFKELHDAQQQDDHKYISRWLNNSDNAAWRTKEGKV